MIHHTQRTQNRQLHARYAVEVPWISMLCCLKLPFVITVTTIRWKNQNPLERRYWETLVHLEPYFYVAGYTSAHYSSALSNEKQLTAATNRMRTRHYLKRWELLHEKAMNTKCEGCCRSLCYTKRRQFTSLPSDTWELSLSLKSKKSGTLTCHHWLSAALLLVMNTNSSPGVKKKALARRVKFSAPHLLQNFHLKMHIQRKKMLLLSEES